MQRETMLACSGCLLELKKGLSFAKESEGVGESVQLRPLLGASEGGEEDTICRLVCVCCFCACLPRCVLVIKCCEVFVVTIKGKNDTIRIGTIVGSNGNAYSMCAFEKKCVVTFVAWIDLASGDAGIGGVIGNSQG